MNEQRSTCTCSNNLPNAVVHVKRNYFKIISAFEIILFQRMDTCLKLFQNHFRGWAQLRNIFQHVQCRWNNSEIILVLYFTCNHCDLTFRVLISWRAAFVVVVIVCFIFSFSYSTCRIYLLCVEIFGVKIVLEQYWQRLWTVLIALWY